MSRFFPGWLPLPTECIMFSILPTLSTIFSIIPTLCPIAFHLTHGVYNNIIVSNLTHIVYNIVPSYPQRVPRMRFMIKKAPRRTREQK